MDTPDIKPALTNLPFIDTGRLLLRKLKLEDASDIYMYAQLPEVVKYSIGYAHQSLAESERFINNVFECYENNSAGLWAIVWQETGRVIGTCGFEYWLHDQFRAEIGYSLSPSYWNRGIMTEAIQEVVRFGFEDMSLNRIEAICHTENLPSQKVLAKNGFINEAFLKQHTHSRGVFFDVYLFSKLNPQNLL